MKRLRNLYGTIKHRLTARSYVMGANGTKLTVPRRWRTGIIQDTVTYAEYEAVVKERRKDQRSRLQPVYRNSPEYQMQNINLAARMGLISHDLAQRMLEQVQRRL